jgi:hypothetical protein
MVRAMLIAVAAVSGVGVEAGAHPASSAAIKIVCRSPGFILLYLLQMGLSSWKWPI